MVTISMMSSSRLFELTIRKRLFEKVTKNGVVYLVLKRVFVCFEKNTMS